MLHVGMKKARKNERVSGLSSQISGVYAGQCWGGFVF
jgi:hypothetical protein